MKIVRLLITMVILLGFAEIVHAKHTGTRKVSPPSVDGIIISIAANADNMVVQPNYATDDPGLPTVAVVVDSKTKVTVDGATGKHFSDLKVGFKVHCTGGKANSGTIASIIAFSIKS